MITEHVLNHAEVKSTANPFPGLRSFEYHENDLFFGREGQSEEMVLKLDKTHFLAVVGTSGSGKSSLVRAGLWPALRGDLMESAGSAWRIVVMRPGNSPIANLAIALNYPVDLKSKGSEQVCVPTVKTAQTEGTLRRGSPGLIEAVRQAQLGPQESLLIVVDQFEELFRFARISEDEDYANDAAAFVKLLLEAKQQPEIYIVLTMRSDYLGECARFWGLPEAINEGQYLIPRMTLTERREAITGPIGVRGASISPRLVDQLLIDMGESPQQLPILQHAMMRIWENWRTKGDDNAPLDILHYQECGGLAETLSRHANEAYAELPDDRSRWIAEKLFKCLTEKGEDVKETRRPTELEEICRIADAKEEEVVAVINIFRREGRCFLMPSEIVPLTGDTAIDISHESLISNWQTLKKWVEDEAYSARVYRLLIERLLIDRQEEPLSTYRLQQALDWREQTRPNVTWASRHHVRFYRPNESSQQAKRERDGEIFQRVMALIGTSEKMRDREKEARERERQKKLKQARRSIAILAGVSALILGLALLFWNSRNEAQEQSGIISHLNYRTIMNGAQNAYSYENFGEANRLLDLNEKQLRGFEWYYLRQMLHNERATLKGDSGNEHSGKVYVAISPDGQTIATGSENGWLNLWDANTQKLKKTLTGHSKAITSVAFAPDGKTLVTGSFDETMILWDPSTGTPKKEPHSFSNPDKSIPEDKRIPRAVRTIAFAPNGLMAVGLEDGGIEIFLDGRQVKALDKSPSTGAKSRNPVVSVAFSPDGTKLVSKSDSDIDIDSDREQAKLWDVSTWQKEIELPNSKSVLSMAFSPDGKTIAGGTRRGLVRLWDTKSGEEKGCLAKRTRRINDPELTGPCDSPRDASNNPRNGPSTGPTITGPTILSLAFADNDTLIIGNYDATLRLWKISTREEILVLKGHSKEVSSVAFSPDWKTVVTGSPDATAKLWDITQPMQTNEQDPKASSIVFFPGKEDKLLVGVRADGSVAIWDRDSRRELQLLPGSEAGILSLAVATDRTIASWSEGNKVRLWVPTTDGRYEYLSEKIIPTSPGRTFTSAAFSPDGKMLATGSDDGTVKLWDTSTGGELSPLSEHHSKKVLSVAFSSDGKMLATGSADRYIMLWDTKTGKLSRRLEGHLNDVLNVAFSPDNKILASGSSDYTARFWNVDTGKELTTLSRYEGPVESVAFSRDGTRLATGSDGRVKLWDTIIIQSERERWQELAEFRTYKWNPRGFRRDEERKIQSLAFSPDGMTIVIGRKNDLDLWLAATPEEVETQSK